MLLIQYDVVSEALSEALKGISVSTELVEEELKPHLDVLLNLLLEKSKCLHQTHQFLHFHVCVSLYIHPYQCICNLRFFQLCVHV